VTIHLGPCEQCQRYEKLAPSPLIPPTPVAAAKKQTEENMLPDIPQEQQLGILRKMLMIRRTEEHCIRFHAEHEGLIRGHFHVYIGQEATGVAVCESLNAGD